MASVDGEKHADELSCARKYGLYLDGFVRFIQMLARCDADRDGRYLPADERSKFGSAGRGSRLDVQRLQNAPGVSDQGVSEADASRPSAGKDVERDARARPRRNLCNNVFQLLTHFAHHLFRLTADFKPQDRARRDSIKRGSTRYGSQKDVCSGPPWDSHLH